MFIVKKAVKDYAKEQKRRVSREFLFLLERKVQETLDYYIKLNSKITLRP